MHEARQVSKSRTVARAVEGVEPARRLRVIALAMCACVIVLAWPADAHGGWPLAAPGRVALGFGDVYTSGEGDGSRHRGVDIEAAAGDSVRAPLSGRISFAGSVPAVGGGRALAVTIETSSGKVTLLPLGHLSASRGSQVAEGDCVGTLAEAGDGSSAGTHLHVGAREGDLYVDPLGIMAPPPLPTEGAGAGDGAAAGSLAGSGAQSGAGESAAVPTGVGITTGVSIAPVPGAAGAPSPIAASQSGQTTRSGQATRPSRAAKLSHRMGTASAGEAASGVRLAPLAGAPLDAAAAPTTVGRGESVGGMSAALAAPQATVLTKDGVVVAASSLATPRQSAAPAWSAIVTGVQAAARRSLRLASLVLLGVMASLGALWPLWRKEPGKVLVSAVREDIAAAPSR